MESKYILYDVLGSLKSMVVNYAFSLNEASSEFLYKEYKKELYELAYGKVILEDKAKEIVENMKPYGEHFKLEEAKKAV